MSDYTQTTQFAPKDSMSSGNPAKVIQGDEVDPELLAISTAIATKLDSTDIASEGEAEALASNVKLISPLRFLDAFQNGNFTTGIGLISLLTADSSPDETADYVVTYDASATQLKKALLKNVWTPFAFAQKSTDTTRTGAPAASADPHLSVPVDANSTYRIEAILTATVTGSPNAAFTNLALIQSTPDGTGMISSHCRDSDEGTNSAADHTDGGLSAPGFGIDGGFIGHTIDSGEYVTVFLYGFVDTVTAGTVTLHWASGANPSTTCTLKAKSALLLTKVA